MRYLLILLICVACSPSKRLNRIVKKNPHLLDSVKIEVIDTIYVERYVHDTITKIVKHDSTIVVDNERVFLKYFYDTVRQEIIHEYECKEVKTVYKTEVKTPRVVINKPTIWEHIVSIWWLILLIIGFYLFKKFFKI
ncbi:MAG: hypothetical protein HRU18_28220 [Pseudoalteromonas sp.]|uniref:hypothetical protein n=1 Tax=Pseudoalteromonas sp. TaxID=53249 RepID=UPI001D6943F0|nr:hypothetical protein [Pseudoalteromonas sp.]NRA82098.1 hypothetical protein [Pseudoalteromonas sp.]